ncbi:YegP family protein [Citrobacter werkmanii]|uniref:YegP family protein n=1 Tax=Citrobacter cronae TaxID=1748967 RepID=UPI0018692746|nr:YegP family protein [Citrobacter cronae]
MEYFEIKKSDKETSQPYYFVLCAKNGKVIATSEMYASKQGAENGIRSVIENAPSAEVRDSTLTKSRMMAALERAMQGK